MKTSLLWLQALSCLILGCRNGNSTQPTANPAAPVPWREAALQAGSMELPCGGLGGIAADPATYSWVYTEPKSACMLHARSLNQAKSKDTALGPIRDCGLISEVGDLTASPAEAEAPTFFYLLGSLAVDKRVDESGNVSFDPGTASLLFQVDAGGAPRSLDTEDNLRSAILAELRDWGQELEASGSKIQREKRAMILGGLAATPSGDFLLSFRAPLVCPVDATKSEECRAIVMLVSDLATLFPSDGKAPVEPKILAHATLYLGGAGIASMEYEPRTEGFLVTSTEGKAYLLRYQPNLTSITMRLLSITPPAGAALRAVVPAPGGAAALFTQDTDSCPASRLSWVPLSVEQLDGIDRSEAPE